jgi:predicted ATPase
MSTEVTKIRIRNFKCLEDVEFELKPLTLLFGPNGSGKSSLIKALRFFSKNIFNSQQNTIFKIDDEVDLIDYNEIVHNNIMEKSVQFDFSKTASSKSLDDYKKYSLSFTFSHSNENICFDEIKFNDEKDNIWCKFKLNQELLSGWVSLRKYEDFVINVDTPDEPAAINEVLFDNILYNFINIKYDQGKNYFKNDLEGVIESLKGDMIDNNWAENDIQFFTERAHLLREKFNTLAKKDLLNFLNFVHINSLRKNPSKIYSFENNIFSEKDYYGFMNNGDTFWNKVNASLASIDLKYKISVKKEKYCGYLQVTSDNGTTFNLTEANSGLIQLLPILAALESLEQNSLLVEQPELHIHPKLQAKLTELFVNKISEKKNIVIETHSEHIVRKLQILIAQRKIDRDKVEILYFDNNNGSTKIRKMELDERGLFLEDWPDGFFDTSSELSLQLLEAISRTNIDKKLN